MSKCILLWVSIGVVNFLGFGSELGQEISDLSHWLKLAVQGEVICLTPVFKALIFISFVPIDLKLTFLPRCEHTLLATAVYAVIHFHLE